MNAFNLRIEESSPAAFADLVLLDFGTIGLEAQAYSVARDVIAAYFDWASVVHANANEVQLSRGDRVVSDMAVGRAGGNAPICRTVSKDVFAHESIVGTDDSNVRAGETHDLKTANVYALDWRGHGSDPSVLLELAKSDAFASDADTGLRVHSCKAGTLVWGGLSIAWDNVGILTEQRYIIFADNDRPFVRTRYKDLIAWAGMVYG